MAGRGKVPCRVTHGQDAGITAEIILFLKMFKYLLYPHSLFSHAKVREGHLSLSDQYGKLMRATSWLTLAQRPDHFSADKHARY